MTPERYARIKELFSAAVELQGKQRDEFLARVCDNDDALQREVESLLAHDASQTILHAAAKTLPNVAAPTVAAPVATPRRKWQARLRKITHLTQHLGPRGHLAIGALLACGALALVCYFSNLGLRTFQRELRREALNEIVDGKVLALEMWLENEAEKVQSWARSKKLRHTVSELVKLAGDAGDVREHVKQSPLQQEIRDELHAFAGREVEFSIWDRRHLLLTETFTNGARIGQSATPWGAGILTVVFEGECKVFAVDKQQAISRFDPSIQLDAHMATMTPVRNENNQIVAALVVHDFSGREKASRILRMVRLGQSGETYVFNRAGLMLSESRFDAQLRNIGLLPDDPDSMSTRNIHLRDPGGNLTKGFKLKEPLSARPLTKMARLCTIGNDGDDMHGYRDYRGVRVVGAWRWLEGLEAGVATELDVDEAEPGLMILVWETWTIVGLFALCMGITLCSYYSIHRLRHQIGENRKVGKYTLEKQIGEGGMGKVFKARHELLKRPTAVKLLKPELVDKENIARFAREASLVSQLEHTNTIRVYDYGVTPEGLFYYVMEYVDGCSLGELIQLDSALPPARTLFLLRQICCSLREAHGDGLVHRDIKPSNIMVCRRGGDCDVVKVLDFGLVKRVETSISQNITATEFVAGTPQYIAPERLSDPQLNDPRSDIYSLAAVAFYLLTGKHFVEGDHLAEVLYRVISAPRRPPSASTNADIPQKLDDLIYQCLSLDPQDRVESMADMIALLDEIHPAAPWTQQDAHAWWQEHETRLRSARDKS